MFPFHQLGSGGELSFQAAGDPEEEEEQVADPLNHEQQQRDLILDDELLAAVNLYTAAGASSESTTISFSSMMRAPAEPIPAADRGRGRARGPGRGRRPEGDGGDDRRKMQHRDIERQRRQEMSSLFSDLRSLLPLDYLKGKRSMSDHIAESANYIKHLQGRIKVLGDTREQLRGTLAGASYEEAQTHHSTTASTTITNNVEVFTSSGGLQVQICCAQGGDPSLLSTSLRVLLEAGLDVVSCVTNKVNGGGLLHNIHCQLTDVGWGEFDVQQLQQRLYQLVCSNT